MSASPLTFLQKKRIQAPSCLQNILNELSRCPKVWWCKNVLSAFSTSRSRFARKKGKMRLNNSDYLELISFDSLCGALFCKDFDEMAAGSGIETFPPRTISLAMTCGIDICVGIVVWAKRGNPQGNSGNRPRSESSSGSPPACSIGVY